MSCSRTSLLTKEHQMHAHGDNIVLTFIDLSRVLKYFQMYSWHIIWTKNNDGMPCVRWTSCIWCTHIISLITTAKIAQDPQQTTSCITYNWRRDCFDSSLLLTQSLGDSLVLSSAAIDVSNILPVCSQNLWQRWFRPQCCHLQIRLGKETKTWHIICKNSRYLNKRKLSFE